MHSLRQIGKTEWWPPLSLKMSLFQRFYLLVSLWNNISQKKEQTIIWNNLLLIFSLSMFRICYFNMDAVINVIYIYAVDIYNDCKDYVWVYYMCIHSDNPGIVFFYCPKSILSRYLYEANNNLHVAAFFPFPKRLEWGIDNFTISTSKLIVSLKTKEEFESY